MIKMPRTWRKVPGLKTIGKHVCDLLGPLSPPSSHVFSNLGSEFYPVEYLISTGDMIMFCDFFNMNESFHLEVPNACMNEWHRVV